MRVVLLASVFSFALVLVALPARAEPITVFAAASLKNAFDVIGAAFTEQMGTQVVISYAGTSVLARQIEQGAPADIFASAHPVWMDYLDERGLINTETRTTLAGNTLVLIAPQNTQIEAQPNLGSANDMLRMLGEDGRLALALVDAVPAGIYAREVMTNLGIWNALLPRLVQTDNVRAALRLVALGEASLGIVYASDAVAEPHVMQLAAFDSERHSPIVYDVALTEFTKHTQALAFMRFLQSASVRDALSSNGFSIMSCPLASQVGHCDGVE
jgi:molybdate transport system substrate-binding protein